MRQVGDQRLKKVGKQVTMMNTSAKVSAILIGTAVFLMLLLPIYIAPKAYYNGFPILTNFIPLFIILGFVLTVAGTLYFIFERKAEEKHQQLSKSSI